LQRKRILWLWIADRRRLYTALLVMMLALAKINPFLPNLNKEFGCCGQGNLFIKNDIQ